MHPLITAASNGDLSVVKTILSTTNVNEFINAVDDRDATALRHASESGYAEVVSALIDSGAVVEVGDHGGFTELHLASHRNHVAVARVLLERGGAAVDAATDRHGSSPLSIASCFGYSEMVALLLSFGAVVDKRDGNTSTPLMCASEMGHLAAASQLLLHGADVNCTSESGWTALMKASFAGRSEVVDMLLDAGAPVDTHDEDGFTALMMACDGAQVVCVKIFLARGASTERTELGGVPSCWPVKGAVTSLRSFFTTARTGNNVSCARKARIAIHQLRNTMVEPCYHISLSQTTTHFVFSESLSILQQRRTRSAVKVPMPPKKQRTNEPKRQLPYSTGPEDWPDLYKEWAAYPPKVFLDSHDPLLQEVSSRMFCPRKTPMELAAVDALVLRKLLLAKRGSSYWKWNYSLFGGVFRVCREVWRRASLLDEQYSQRILVGVAEAPRGDDDRAKRRGTWRRLRELAVHGRSTRAT